MKFKEWFVYRESLRLALQKPHKLLNRPNMMRGLDSIGGVTHSRPQPWVASNLMHPGIPSFAAFAKDGMQSNPSSLRFDLISIPTR